jgi:hypothetical protein
MFGTRTAVILSVAIALGFGTFSPSRAEACGGFFCSQSQGVNQAAERIVFAKNGDGTVTAVIEIQYEGPSEKFSWLLPISSVPEGDEIAVGSSLSFQRLQQATNPQYTLSTRIEGTCDVSDRGQGFGGTSGGGIALSPSGSGGASSAGSGVKVEASGAVGSFEWTVISVDPSLEEPADAAVIWLEENGYDVPAGAPGLLGPYLEDGLYLLALRLQKGADAGSIRPIVLTYDAEKPIIPIKLTAVAANADMGVLTWVLGDARAVPENYYSLELNEARINWFNANSNYNDVVTAAANEAGGQGFVTEYAQPTSGLANRTWSTFDEERWTFVRSAEPSNLFSSSMFELSQWDGYWDVVRKHVTLPAGVTIEQLQSCPQCYFGESVVGPDFVAALEREVIEPARVVQKIIDAHPQITRLYSTLSAEEMTADPLFTFNPSLEPVSNVHTAERVIECAPGYTAQDAPWRIELPQGGVIRGGATDVGVWPAFQNQPANRRVMRSGASGPGKVVEDNGDAIDAAVASYSNSVKTTPPGGSAGSSGGPATTPGAENGSMPGASARGGGGCGLASASPEGPAWLSLAGVFLAMLGRRSRTRRNER